MVDRETTKRDDSNLAWTLCMGRIVVRIRFKASIETIVCFDSTVQHRSELLRR